MPFIAGYWVTESKAGISSQTNAGKMSFLICYHHHHNVIIIINADYSLIYQQSLNYKWTISLIILNIAYLKWF